MHWRKLAALIAVGGLLHVSVAAAQRDPSISVPASPAVAEEQATETAEQRLKLSDAVVIALIIAASIKLYKAKRGPCACPSDTMRNGRSCGNNSAWSKPGGAKPLCTPADVTPAMINSWRATKAIPGLF